MTDPQAGSFESAYDGDDRELRDLIERASQIQEMTLHAGWQHLTDYIYSHTATFQQRLVTGRCESFEQYKDIAGWVRGITDALAVPEKLQQQIQARILAAQEGREPDEDAIRDDS